MKVEIYGTETCTFCKQAVKLCEANFIAYSYVDVSDATEFQNLSERLGSRPRSVPQIFLNGNHIPDGYKGLRAELSKV